MLFPDNLLNRITMYRAILYYLCGIFLTATFLSLINVLPYSPLDFILSGIFILFGCWVSNYIFARLFKVQPNVESVWITAFILILIIGPLSLFSNVFFLAAASVLAMASKYIIVYKKTHIFNPAAFGVVVTAIFMGKGASWWAGDPILLPFIIVGGLLLVRKINRFHLVTSFLLSSSFFLLLFQRLEPADIQGYILNTATLFFSFVMLTEPITSPADRKMRMAFGIFAGLAMTIFQMLGIFYAMELSLLSSNLLFRIVHFATRYHLILKEKIQLSNSIWEFVFAPQQPINFKAGQYLEWTLPHSPTDTRGHRRYFTIASSPHQKDISLVVRIPEKSSSYKKSLNDMKPGDSLFATNLEGDFVLKKDNNSSYVFIARGVGITPFQSIISYMIDSNVKFPVTLFYIAHYGEEKIFEKLFKMARDKIGLNVIYVIDDKAPEDWKGEQGELTGEMIKRHVPDYTERVFYISGPQPMVQNYKGILAKIGVSRKNIKTDYFPGY